MHGTVITDKSLSLHDCRMLSFGRRRYSRLFLATAGLLVVFNVQQKWDTHSKT